MAVRSCVPVSERTMRWIAIAVTIWVSLDAALIGIVFWKWLL